MTVMNDEKWAEYRVLSRTWRSLIDKQNYYLEESNKHQAVGNHKESMNSFNQYKGYGHACNDLFKIMQDLDKPKQLEIDL
tara:strand:- start:1952 stop:2191 length:240 start_codon:yes stop_codon:yes gene_type:complete